MSSKKVWLYDAKTGQNVTFTNKGEKFQAKIPVTSMFKVVGAAHYDKHDLYDAQWNPKATISSAQVADQTFRVTYNRAFESPSILQTIFSIPGLPAVASACLPAIATTFVIKNAAGTTVRTIDPIPARGQHDVGSRVHVG